MKSLIAISAAALLACSAPALAGPHGGHGAGGGHPGGGGHASVRVSGGHGGFGHGDRDHGGFHRDGRGFGRSGGYWCHGIWVLELPVIGCL